MKFKTEYDTYIETMRAYRFIPMDYITWLSWKLNVPIHELKRQMEKNGEWKDSYSKYGIKSNPRRRKYKVRKNKHRYSRKTKRNCACNKKRRSR